MKYKFVVFFQSTSNYYLLMTDDSPHTIVGFPTLKKGLDYFEKSYNNNHDRSYEASMSACINFIEFQPRIVEFQDIEEIKVILKNPINLHSLSSISGNYLVLKLNKKLAKKYYDNGKTPKLIS